MATCAAGSPALGEHEGRFAARAEVPPRQGGAVGPGVTAPRRQRGKSARRLRSVGLGLRRLELSRKHRSGPIHHLRLSGLVSGRRRPGRLLRWLGGMARTRLCAAGLHEARIPHALAARCPGGAAGVVVLELRARSRIGGRRAHRLVRRLGGGVRGFGDRLHLGGLDGFVLSGRRARSGGCSRSCLRRAVDCARRQHRRGGDNQRRRICRPATAGGRRLVLGGAGHSLRR
mmetsp:Transcript_34572/g.111635  ORF Transcript_34572/g.111635 Transcript_34572/m.111635 type:complete len:230 (-) Transcript_34572:36-725(-)|eukprot:scaffold9925_cov101-Isochrysis_galbana.AAC.2